MVVASKKKIDVNELSSLGAYCCKMMMRWMFINFRRLSSMRSTRYEPIMEAMEPIPSLGLSLPHKTPRLILVLSTSQLSIQEDGDGILRKRPSGQCTCLANAVSGISVRFCVTLVPENGQVRYIYSVWRVYLRGHSGNQNSRFYLVKHRMIRCQRSRRPGAGGNNYGPTLNRSANSSINSNPGFVPMKYKS